MRTNRYQIPRGGHAYVAQLRTRDEDLAFELSEAVGRIGSTAWGESDWLLKTVGDRKTARTKAIELFNDSERTLRRFDTILHSGQRAIWGAFKTAVIAPENMIGFVAVEPDVSGSPRTIATKRVLDVVSTITRYPKSRVYTKIEGVDVHPDYQGAGLGLALAHSALMKTADRRHTTAYTFDTNQQVIEMLSTNDFELTASAEDPTRPAVTVNTDYFGEDYPVNQLRFESTGDALQTVASLEHGHNWLRSYTKVS